MKLKKVSEKFLKLTKKHPILVIVLTVLCIWAVRKLWPMVFALLFSHMPETHVETLILKSQASAQHWQSIGIVKAAQDIIVSSEVSGIVQDLAVPQGQAVKEKVVLLNIRHDDILANLQKDQAILTQKQVYYLRLQRLSKTNAISQETFSEALSAFQQAEASVNADQAQLDKYIIKAPFSGQIGIWQVDIGQLVRPGDPLVTLTQLSPAYIDFMLPVKALSSVQVGDNIQFTTSSYANRIWQGKIVALDPQLDPITHGLRLRAQIDNRDGKLVPRLYGQVVVIKKLSPQIYIPQEAVIYDPKGTSVYIVQNKLAKPQPITLGNHQGNDVIVKNGLKPGDEIVTAGMMKLFPNVPVIINKQIVQAQSA
ncbi:MAG: efflux RND transporter periplasmic adaptor subunit [Gammaproteobacteria bacterium]|nr:efflux RND transporter periplasmic adaptor subunit [Gammaproteobacteria bacterium]